MVVKMARLQIWRKLCSWFVPKIKPLFTEIDRPHAILADLVRAAGLEPAWGRPRQILSLLRVNQTIDIKDKNATI